MLLCSGRAGAASVVSVTLTPSDLYGGLASEMVINLDSPPDYGGQDFAASAIWVITPPWTTPPE